MEGLGRWLSMRGPPRLPHSRALLEKRSAKTREEAGDGCAELGPLATDGLVRRVAICAGHL